MPLFKKKNLQYSLMLALSVLMAACSSTGQKPSEENLYLMPRSYQLELRDNNPASMVEMGKIELHYVELLGLEDYKVEKKINQYIRKISGTEDPYDGSTDVTVTVKESKLGKGWMHLKSEIYRFPHGAAHGENTVFSVYFDLKTGNVISLNQVLKPGFEASLNEKIKQWLSKQDYQSDFTALANNPCFYQDAGTVYFCFNQATIAPSVAGIVNVPVAKSEMQSFIVKGSLLDTL